MVNVALTPVAPNADVDKHNPIGKIPALSVKGIDLFDSPVICEYLDNQHKGRKLLPRKGRERWVALRQQAMADGLLDAALLARYEGCAEARGQALARLDQGPDEEDRRRARPARGRDQVAQGQADLGTISVACALGYLDFRFADHDWRASIPSSPSGSTSFSKTAVDQDDGAAAGLSKRRMTARRDHRAPRAAAASRGRPLRQTFRAPEGRRTAIYFLLKAGERSHWHKSSMPTRSGITMPARRWNCR